MNIDPTYNFDNQLNTQPSFTFIPYDKSACWKCDQNLLLNSTGRSVFIMCDKHTYDEEA